MAKGSGGGGGRGRSATLGKARSIIGKQSFAPANAQNLIAGRIVSTQDGFGVYRDSGSPNNSGRKFPDRYASVTLLGGQLTAVKHSRITVSRLTEKELESLVLK